MFKLLKCKSQIFAFILLILVSENYGDRDLFDSISRVVKGRKTLLNDAINEKQNEIQNKMKIKMYTGSSIKVAEIRNFSLDSPEEIYVAIDHKKPVTLYFHGYTESPSVESVQTIVNAYLKLNEENILVLDWSELASGNYATVISGMKNISQILAKYFDLLFDMGMDLKSFHVVGHSLGGQLAGFFGKYSKHSIPRITGLDPAKPGFYLPGSDHIDKTHAELVDIIHTDSGFYGAQGNIGSADFYANSGSRIQPGCPLVGLPLSPQDFCSHWRSWRIYAESVNNLYAFPATKCSSYLSFITGGCSKNEVIYIGYAIPQNVTGSYYFQTNSKSPFGKSSVNEQH